MFVIILFTITTEIFVIMFILLYEFFGFVQKVNQNPIIFQPTGLHLEGFP